MHPSLYSDAIDDCRPGLLVLIPSDFTSVEPIISNTIALGSMRGVARDTLVIFDTLETPRGDVILHSDPEHTATADAVSTLLMALGYGVTREVGVA